MPQPRKILSNLLWTPQGWVRQPLVEVAADGSVCVAGACSEPDRVAFAEFRPGVVVLDFPVDFRAAFESFRASPGLSLGEWLPRVVVPGRGVAVLISGFDCGSLRLTPQSRIERL
ncbi:MAG: cytosine deaminase [Alistipes sp.]|nr:cytosine deaminase [Alistipes sp.]